MKKINKKPFYTTGMTVKQILNLGDEIISRFDTRDLSRALRTVALAANKRIKRLTQYLKRRNGKWVEKVNSPGLDTRAINALGKKRFGVGNKSRNEMYEEFARARSFMRAKGSTVMGAISIRKAHEMALFGATREELTKGMSPKEKKEKTEEIKELSSDVYETYEEFENEYANKGKYEKDKGREILQHIGNEMLEGATPEEAKESAKKFEDLKYEQEEEITQSQEDWDEFSAPKEWWEEL